MTKPVAKLGKYSIHSRIGQGGMGSVYRAVQDELGREVAIKVLTEQSLEQMPDLQKRFLLEASSCARLSHPNIVKVFDYGYENGCYYYVMELIDCPSLEAKLKQEPIQSVATTLSVARDLAAACSHYHPLGIVHRDIKPANILMGPEGQAVLTDFGLVKDLGATGVTKLGAAVGTPHYLPPEMLRGETVDGASDLYQIGVVLYRMLTGCFPFDGTRVDEILPKLLYDEPTPVDIRNPSISPVVSNLVMNCLAKQRDTRYASAEELTADIDLAVRRRSIVRRAASSEPHGPAPIESKGESSARTRAPGRPPRMLSRQPIAAAGPSVSAVQASGAASGRRAGLAAGLVCLAFGLIWIAWQRPAGHEPSDVLLRAGLKRARLEWKSAAPSQGIVEWRTAGSRGWETVRESSEATNHAVELGPLPPGKSFVCRIALPGGATSLEYPFRTGAAAIAPTRLQVAPGRLELSFDTAVAITARLTVGSREAREGQPAIRHALAVDGCDPTTQPIFLVCVDQLDDEIPLEGVELLRACREALAPELIASLVRASRSFDPGPQLLAPIDKALPGSVLVDAIDMFVTTGVDGYLAEKFRGKMPLYLGFGAADPAGLALATRLDKSIDSLEPVKSVRALALLAPGLLDDRTLPLETIAALHGVLSRLQDIDFYARLLDLPCRTGVERLLARDFVVLAKPSPAPTGGTLVEAIPGTRLFAHPPGEYLALQSAGVLPTSERNCLVSHEWTPTLPPPSTFRRVEIALENLKLESELAYRVIVNGRISLLLRQVGPRPGRVPNPALPFLAMSFDPRFLSLGRNSLVLDVVRSAGARHLGMRCLNTLSTMQLSWSNR